MEFVQVGGGHRTLFSKHDGAANAAQVAQTKTLFDMRRAPDKHVVSANRRLPRCVAYAAKSLLRTDWEQAVASSTER